GAGALGDIEKVSLLCIGRALHPFGDIARHRQPRTGQLVPKAVIKAARQPPIQLHRKILTPPPNLHQLQAFPLKAYSLKLAAYFQPPAARSTPDVSFLPSIPPDRGRSRGPDARKYGSAAFPG